MRENDHFNSRGLTDWSKPGEADPSAHERRQVVPAVRNFSKGVFTESLGTLGELLPAHRLIEHPRAIGLENPEVEAEIAVAHEMARRRAHEGAADATALVRLEHVERVDLRLESFEGLARRAAARESDDALAR